MPVAELEEIMVRFIKQEINVLVCTTIIESGLDIPAANTIVITRADQLGLAEIYQLRGRVGRRNEQAYAYLLVPDTDALSKEARQRLKALMDYNDLGGGFKLAMSDLQIRGGGNILGESQSGNIAAVGYDLYLELLQKTVLELKERARGNAAFLEDIEPEVKLKLPAFIPGEYIPDIDQRYIAYRKITCVADSDELDDIENELRDRYGPLPAECENLFEMTAIKLTLRRIKALKLEQGPARIALSFHEKTPLTVERLLAFIQAWPSPCRLTPDGKLIIQLEREQAKAPPLATAKKILRSLEGNDMKMVDNISKIQKESPRQTRS